MRISGKGSFRRSRAHAALAGIAFVGLSIAAASALPSCGGEEAPRRGATFQCFRDDNACQCGDPGEVLLQGEPVGACPGSVPEGPHRCCRSADTCLCEPYVCIGGLTNQCVCWYTFNPVRPYRCLTSAAKAATQSSDPAAGDHCCAWADNAQGYCECSPGECEPGSIEVSECSPETALAVCPEGFDEVASCTD